MIQLHPDYLLFQTATGEAIPCSAETVTVELMGESASHLDPDIIRNAAAAVLHYFKNDLGRNFVSVQEFSQALERVLKSFGFSVSSETDDLGAGGDPQNVVTSDLTQLARDSGKSFELAFFPTLRDELRRQLKESPRVLRFNGLRPCVKNLIGAKRWCDRCQRLSDQIVNYVRHCLETDAQQESCCNVVIR